MRGEKGRRAREELPGLGTRGQETNIAKMAELHRDQTRGKEVETQPLGGRCLGQRGPDKECWKELWALNETCPGFEQSHGINEKHKVSACVQTV